MPGPRHLLFAICDHYEPLTGGASDVVGQSRVREWIEEYPRLAADFRDADGRPPRYGFFFPGEEYRPEFLDGLAQLASAGYGEVELHLHHEDDTPTQLTQSIETYLRQFAEHGHISRDADGRYRYAFIHGNWCLANARADGRMCGVDNELPLLFETGCVRRQNISDKRARLLRDGSWFWPRPRLRPGTPFYDVASSAA